MFSFEHASSTDPAVMEEGGGGGGGAAGLASCLVAKQAVEFPQVLASNYFYMKKRTKSSPFFGHYKGLGVVYQSLLSAFAYGTYSYLLSLTKWDILKADIMTNI